MRSESEAVLCIEDDSAATHRIERIFRAQTRLLELLASGAPLRGVLDCLDRTIESEVEGGLCSVLILEGDRLYNAAAPSLPRGYLDAIEGAQIGPGVGSCGHAAYANVLTIAEDLSVHPYWASYRDHALKYGLRSCWSSPIRGSTGEVLGTFAIYHREPHRPSAQDLEFIEGASHIAGIAIERRRLDESLARRTAELVEVDRRKDVFLATLAHELRNPLAPIVTALELLHHVPAVPDAAAQPLAIIERQVQHLARLVNDLMDVSRIGQGRIELRKQRVCVDTVVRDALEISRAVVTAQRHDLIVKLPPTPITLEADPLRLTQVIANLLHNAAKYTPPGGHIALEARLEGEQLVITVRDSGIGMTPDLVDTAFDLFMQADRSLDRSQGGLGIGLTLVKSIVTQHGGTVHAESAGLGLGSTFVVRLPATAAAPPERSAPPELAADACPPAARKRVLVVDDNADAAEMLAMALESADYEVRTAFDGPTALATCEAWRPGAMLLDIGLPGLDGYEVATRLRKRFDRAALRLVALSGYGNAAAHEAAAAAGFDVALVKPVDIDTILRALAGPETAGCLETANILRRPTPDREDLARQASLETCHMKVSQEQDDEAQ